MTANYKMVLRSRLLLAAAAGGLLVCSARAQAVVYDANQDLKAFELATTGPAAGANGVWSYGTAASASLAPSGAVPSSATFAPFSATEHNDAIVLPGVPAGALQGWQEDMIGDLVPAIAVNTTGGDVASSCCGVYQADEIWMHGNPGGSPREFVVVRWTAPAAGTVNYTARFINEGGGASGVYVLIGGNGSFSGTSAGSDFASATVASGNGFSVQPGTTFDFAVGPNPTNGNYGGTSTGFFATIDFTPIPEPAGLAVVGAAGAATMLRRRRQQ